MDEDKKYYTPSIEEFHVGFEYELLEDDGLGNNSWWSQYFEGILAGKRASFIFTFERLAELIKDEDVRVKYLDKEDIESTVFASHVTDESGGFYKYMNYTLHHTIQENRVFITQNDDGNNIVLFSGIVRNKSELKRIIQQTQIHE